MVLERMTECSVQELADGLDKTSDNLLVIALQGSL